LGETKEKLDKAKEENEGFKEENEKITKEIRVIKQKVIPFPSYPCPIDRDQQLDEGD